MKVSEAITKADSLRLNTITDEQKADWLYELDCEIAEMQEVDNPEKTWPNDRELLMESPHDNIYPLYLISMYDYYNQETDLYANDSEIFNQAYADAKAYYRRHNVPKCRGNWRTM